MGRKIEYNDQYHIVQRQKMREIRTQTRMRQYLERKHPSLALFKEIKKE